MDRIHVRQDQSSHMYWLSEYQNTVSKSIESIKTLLHDRKSQNRKKKRVLVAEKDVSTGSCLVARSPRNRRTLQESLQNVRLSSNWV
jgi:hypothetical protein